MERSKEFSLKLPTGDTFARKIDAGDRSYTMMKFTIHIEIQALRALHCILKIF